MNANIIYSIKRTASASLFNSWSSISLPVFYTNDLKSFHVIDIEGSHYSQYMMYSFPSVVYNIRKTPPGYIEYNFKIAHDFHVSSAFPLEYFNSTKIIGIFRHPRERRMSEFLEKLTLKCINQKCASLKLNTRVKKKNVLSDMYELHYALKHSSISDSTLEFFTQIVVNSRALPCIEDVYKIFTKDYCNIDKLEYCNYINKLYRFTGVYADCTDLKETGLFLCQKPGVSIMLMKMENINDLGEEIRIFTGITNFRFDNSLHEESFIINNDYSFIRSYLSRKNFNMYSDSSTEESMVVLNLGYE